MLIRIPSFFIALLIFYLFIDEMNRCNSNLFFLIIFFLGMFVFAYYAIMGFIPYLLVHPDAFSHNLDQRMTKIVDNCFKKAFDKKIEIISEEFFFYAMLKDEKIIKLIQNCDIDINEIKADLLKFINNHEKNKTLKKEQIRFTTDLRKKLNYAYDIAFFLKEHEDGNLPDYVLPLILIKNEKILLTSLDHIKLKEHFSYQLLRQDNIDLTLLYPAVKKAELNKKNNYNVVIYNDNFTTMAFAVELISTLFNKTEEEAINIMIEIHSKGSFICGEYNYDDAVDLMSKIHNLARKNSHPLMCGIQIPKINH